MIMRLLANKVIIQAVLQRLLYRRRKECNTMHPAKIVPPQTLTRLHGSLSIEMQGTTLKDSLYSSVQPLTASFQRLPLKLCRRYREHFPIRDVKPFLTHGLRGLLGHFRACGRSRC